MLPNRNLSRPAQWCFHDVEFTKQFDQWFKSGLADGQAAVHIGFAKFKIRLDDETDQCSPVMYLYLGNGPSPAPARRSCRPVGVVTVGSPAMMNRRNRARASLSSMESPYQLICRQSLTEL